MNWIFNIRKDKVWKEDGTAGIQALYLRPVWEEEGKKLTSGIIDIRVSSVEYLLSALETVNYTAEAKEYLQERIGKTMNSDYFVDEKPLREQDKSIYLHQADLYVHKDFTKPVLLNWMRLYLAIQGYPCDNLKETTYDDFAFDLNPLLQVFSAESVKAFEDVLGYEWWKQHKKQPTDTALIKKLLNEIHNN